MTDFEQPGFGIPGLSDSDINRLHDYDDRDSSILAHHHTLGITPNQSSPGDHIHDGKTSPKPTLPRCKGFNSLGPNVNDNITSATFVNCAAGGAIVSFIFTKLYSWTGLKLEVHAGFLPTIGNSGAKFALQINGIDYEVCTMLGNTVNVHVWSSGTRILDPLVTPISAGIYTIPLRWRLYFGTSLRRDVNDSQSVSITEMVVAP